jgi:hypothetical protein
MIRNILNYAKEYLTCEQVFVVTKTMQVVAKSPEHAVQLAKCQAENSFNWEWSVKSDTEELF